MMSAAEASSSSWNSKELAVSAATLQMGCKGVSRGWQGINGLRAHPSLAQSNNAAPLLSSASC